jgi:predicted NAD/FAD-dependent oxidoreductase
MFIDSVCIDSVCIDNGGLIGSMCTDTYPHAAVVVVVYDLSQGAGEAVAVRLLDLRHQPVFELGRTHL